MTGGIVEKRGFNLSANIGQGIKLLMQLAENICGKINQQPLQLRQLGKGMF